MLHFKTKYDNTQTLPVTAEIAKILDGCNREGVPFVAQLPRGHRGGKALEPLGRCSAITLRQVFAKLKARLGIRKDVKPHDLRRTKVRRIYDETMDLRMAQALLGHENLAATLWYLQAANKPVPRELLELAKLNPATEVVQ